MTESEDRDGDEDDEIAYNPHNSSLYSPSKSSSAFLSPKAMHDAEDDDSDTDLDAPLVRCRIYFPCLLCVIIIIIIISVVSVDV